VAILSGKNQLIVANRALSAISRQADGIHLSRAGLAFHRPEQQAEFQKHLERCVGASRRKQNPAGPLSIVRPSGKKPYSIHFRVLAGADAQSGDHVMICVCDPASCEHMDPKALIGLFGLSLSEANLAVALVETGTLQAAAKRCRITEGSARQYIKRTFQKTQTSGQVELVALLVKSLPI